ncbi:hypothetical protein J4219_05525 [Candidatus Woesearchaeota archaeon]|nr:hypothetical protein [Candidatus Woesearchaeota archaeon]
MCDIFDIVDIPQCVLDTIIEFVQSAINAPLIPFLQTIKMLLTQPANIAPFGSLWAVIIYLISTFYGLFIMFAGLNFIISAYSPERRYRAKEWLQNVILMIICVQASFLIYSLVSQLASGLAGVIVRMINPNFFYITLDGALNAGFSIALGFAYFLTLLVTIVTFSVNYFLASVGVVFFPFGVFLYFIPPLRDIGKFIISKLMFILFLPFFASILLLGVSQLMNISGFSGIKILFMISAFVAVNALMFLLALLAIFRSVMGVMRSDVARGLLFFKGHLAPALSKQELSPPNERDYYGRFRKDYYERRAR